MVAKPRRATAKRPAKAASAKATPAKAEGPAKVAAASFADAPPVAATPDVLRNICEVRHVFRTNCVPIFFIGATPLNLLGLDRWVRNFSYITYYDGWDGAHPRVFTPSNKPYPEFEVGEAINNWLLNNAEIRARRTRGRQRGTGPRSPWGSSTRKPSASARNWART